MTSLFAFISVLFFVCAAGFDAPFDETIDIYDEPFDDFQYEDDYQGVDDESFTEAPEDYDDAPYEEDYEITEEVPSNYELETEDVKYVSSARKCKIVADIGFLMDASGSIKDNYDDEKTFVKALASSFGISKTGARVSVGTFSKWAKLNIKFNDYTDVKSFKDAVDKISFIGLKTRIDLGLKTAKNEMLNAKNGARKGVPKVLILLTDGSQTKSKGYTEPSIIAKDLVANHGVNLIVIGMGSLINKAELEKIAGGPDNTFTAANFKTLLSDEFIQKLQDKSCLEAQRLCNMKADVGFLMDASGSIKTHFSKEKEFVKALATAFGISKSHSRASVCTFSKWVTLNIKFNDYMDQKSFNKAVDKIPFIGLNTRIDLVLTKAKAKMFNEKNGARKGVPKLLFLLTDGQQSKTEGYTHPQKVAKELRALGVHLIVVGMGKLVSKPELESIAGHPDMAFTADTYKILLDKTFIRNLMAKACTEVKGHN